MHTTDYTQIIHEAHQLARPITPSEHCKAGTVGSVIISRSGKKYTGICLDFSCSLGFCAEHAAIAEMLKAHESEIALVVAVNSDGSVRELKGAGRPLMNENDRAEILAALAPVDYITIFDHVSPRSLIAEVLPDVLVKGGDYPLDQIHGREEVEAAGGKVISLPFVQGASTTSLIERMKKQSTTE